MTRLDENQFVAAYAFAASPARWALERHDWRAAAALEVKPAWFPWHRFRNVEALVYYARAIGAARSGDVVAARRSTDEIAAIRMAMPATRDYNWSGSIGAQWEAATALITVAKGKKDEGVRLLRTAAGHQSSPRSGPVLMNCRASSARHPCSQAVLGSAPVIRKRCRMSWTLCSPVFVFRQ
jgi:hypothetical protein